MSNVFGPKKPLFGPYTYRAKQNSNGDTLIAVYHGSKRIAHIDAYWAYSMRAIEEHEAEEAQRASGSGGTRRRLVCASDLRALGAEGRYPNVLRVGHAFVDDDAYKGKGIGRAMYEAMMAEGFAVRQTRISGQPGPMFLIPDECGGAGNTSADAKRVWASLARDYPSQGTSIRVDAPPVIGSRARANPRRRRNSANTREEAENVPDCAWCGAACDQPHPYPNRRGEVFCSPSHRSASNRALARVLGAHADSTPHRRRNPATGAFSHDDGEQGTGEEVVGTLDGEPVGSILVFSSASDLGKTLLAEGHVRVQGLPRGKVGWLGGIELPESSRNKGHGAAIVAAMLEEARSLGVRSVVLHADSAGSRRFWERVGFVAQPGSIGRVVPMAKVLSGR